MKAKLYKDVKHVFHMNGEEKMLLNEYFRQ